MSWYLFLIKIISLAYLYNAYASLLLFCCMFRILILFMACKKHHYLGGAQGGSISEFPSFFLQFPFFRQFFALFPNFRNQYKKITIFTNFCLFAIILNRYTQIHLDQSHLVHILTGANS